MNVIDVHFDVEIHGGELRRAARDSRTKRAIRVSGLQCGRRAAMGRFLIVEQAK
jgi:hypothetical protein